MNFDFFTRSLSKMDWIGTSAKSSFDILCDSKEVRIMGLIHIVTMIFNFPLQAGEKGKGL